MPKMPQWKPPNHLAKALADGDGSWEDERWSPILVTAMSGTEYEGAHDPGCVADRVRPVGGRIRSGQCEAGGVGRRAGRLRLGQVHPEGNPGGQSGVGEAASHHRLRDGHVRDVGGVGGGLPRAT